MKPINDHLPYKFKRSPAKKLGVALMAVLILLGLFAASLYAAYRYQLRPMSAGQAKAVSFEIPQGMGVPSIANRLKSAGLIRDKNVFAFYVNLHGLRGALQAGSYSLSSKLSTPEIADILSKGKIKSNLLVIPEGSTLVKIEALAAKHGITPGQFKAALKDSYDGKYLAQRPKEVDLEGYLFPEGYQMTNSTTAHQLIQKMVTAFDQKISTNLIDAFAAQGLSLHQGLTLASIIEHEVANASDRPIVAQVFLSRLASGQALQSDVTVIYASIQTGQPFNTQLDSPFNTYRYKGLPVGPICSPGLDALNAAAHPAKTDYTYFIADKNGKTHFAHTLDQHNANISKYLK